MFPCLALSMCRIGVACVLALFLLLPADSIICWEVEGAAGHHETEHAAGHDEGHGERPAHDSEPPADEDSCVCVATAGYFLIDDAPPRQKRGSMRQGPFSNVPVPQAAVAPGTGVFDIRGHPPKGPPERAVERIYLRLGAWLI